MKKIVLVGCGSIAAVHAEAISQMEDCHLAGFADCLIERASAFADKYGGNAYASYEEMLETEQPDVLHICTPHYLHVPMAIYALTHGVNVFMEKPPAITFDQIKELEAAVRASDRRIGFCFQNRYNPCFLKMKELLKGAGKILGARAFVTWNRDAAYYAAADWKGKISTEGGGVLVNQSIHTLDLLVTLLGRPLKVDASLSNHRLKGRIEVEDTIEALVHFTDCDASFYATNAYCCDKPPLIEVACENMTIRMEDPSLTVYHSDGKVEYIPGETLAPIGKLCWGSSHRTCIRDFYDCIDSGAPFAQDWDGVKRSVTLMNSLYLSAREGHPVLLSTMPDCPLSCFADEIADSTDSQIALLKDLGISWVEFRSGDGKGIADYTVAEAEVIWEKLQRNGISVSALGSPIGKINITDDFEPHFETFKHVVKLAKAMHTRYIRMFSFYMPKDEDPGIYRDAVIERLKKLTAYAAEQDVVLLHENEKGIYGDNAPRCLELFKAIDSPHFRATFDFANFVQCGQDPTEAYQMLKPYITYVHIKDALAKDGTVVPGGQGDGHLAEIFANLKAEGYKGFFSLEPHLADFASLQSLEQEVTKRGRSDQEAAFCQAYEAFLGLICIK